MEVRDLCVHLRCAFACLHRRDETATLKRIELPLEGLKNKRRWQSSYTLYLSERRTPGTERRRMCPCAVNMNLGLAYCAQYDMHICENNDIGIF